MNILRVIIKSRNCCVGVQNQIFNEEYSSFNTFLNARQNYHHYVFMYSSFFLIHSFVTKNARVHSQHIIHCNQFMNKTSFIVCFCDILSIFSYSFLHVYCFANTPSIIYVQFSDIVYSLVTCYLLLEFITVFQQFLAKASSE